MSYKNQRVVIVGLGREGAALARFLVGQGATVTVTDIRERDALRERIDDLDGLPIEYVLGGHPEKLLAADVIFVSPGVSRDIPMLRAARQRGIPLSSETRLFFSLCPAPIIGITGSSGKTTTTSLVGEIMRAGGHRTFVGGNIGAPLVTMVEHMKPEDKVVMELSSFQLEALDHSPHIAAMLNLSPNHLDRHRSMNDYLEAKRNILRFQRSDDYALLNADQRVVSEMANECRGQVLYFSRQHEVDQGAFIRQGEVMVRWKGEELRVCDVAQIQLLGSHNVGNVLAACAVAAPAGAHIEAMTSAVTSFRGVEHRLEFVEEIEGVRYYNDSIATSPDRTIAALASFAEPIILLAGGRGKGLPVQELATLIAKKVKALILFGEAASLLEQAVNKARGENGAPGLPMHRSSSLDDAVNTAALAGKAGDIVLLSPGFTSFDMYQDYAARGNHFRALVREVRDRQKQRFNAAR